MLFPRFKTKAWLVFAFIFDHLSALAQNDTSMTLHFSTASFVLTAPQQDSIRSLVSGRHVKLTAVAGFTDSIGTSASNLLLGMKRAKSVRSAMEGLMICDSFFVESKGEQTPVSMESPGKNRRVELRIYFFPETTGERVTAADSITQVLDLVPIMFEPDMPIMEPASLPVLQEAARKMKTFSCAIYEIWGSVNWIPGRIKDSRGMQQWVQTLSEQRAKEVYGILIDQGIPASIMTYHGKANKDPAVEHPISQSEMKKTCACGSSFTALRLVLCLIGCA